MTSAIEIQSHLLELPGGARPGLNRGAHRGARLTHRSTRRTPVGARQGAGVDRSAAVVAVRLPSRLTASAERVPGSAV